MLKFDETQKGNALKRIADAYEKLGVAGIAVDLFQNAEENVGSAGLLGFAFVCISVLLSLFNRK